MRRDALAADFMRDVEARNPHQPEFTQAVREVVEDVITIEKAHADYSAARVLDRLSEPDRIVSFRVTWQDDKGGIQINRGWRVQYSNAIGPYKGGLRFHPTVSPSVLKFLGFEQVFKNALTGLPLGGAKGGSDFDPRGRSEAEIMRFCQAFMQRLAPFIGPNTDIPAGDINVGTREIGWMFAAYKAYSQEFTGALTGKGRSFGGSEVRVEATGYGLIYFVAAMLGQHDQSIEDKRVAISGKGNVAVHAAEKALIEGARVITLSDTAGTLVAPDGLSQEAIDWVRARKAAGDDIAAPPKHLGARFHENETPWEQDVDIALPCATQNEVDEAAVKTLIENGVSVIAEGANMPLTSEAQARLADTDILYAPGKAANAGGVAVSGLEMSQNSHRQFESSAEVDGALKSIMRQIHAVTYEEGRSSGRVNYARGANIAAFRKVADAITAMGAI